MRLKMKNPRKKLRKKIQKIKVTKCKKEDLKKINLNILESPPIEEFHIVLRLWWVLRLCHYSSRHSHQHNKILKDNVFRTKKAIKMISDGEESGRKRKRALVCLKGFEKGIIRIGYRSLSSLLSVRRQNFGVFFPLFIHSKQVAN